jgi:hypothetical protein
MMKKLFAFSFVMLLTLGIVGIGNATLLKSGLNILDTRTGLTWLHHSVTSDMSYDYVIANLLSTGQEYEGWRYASGEETANLLISNFGFQPGYNLGHRTQEDVDRISALTEMFGDIVGLGGLGVEGSGILGVVGEFSAPPQANYLSVMGSYWFGTDNYYSIMSVGNWTISSSAHMSYYSHFLVKDGENVPVPEPSTMLLLASGLLGLAGFRKRSRE